MIFRQLSGGIRVALDPMPHLHSVSIGVWVNAGSVFETEQNAGISHFIEHMVFKGTTHRSASQIAMEMDAIGANLNAFTAKECTCFHVKALAEDMPLCVDMLADLTLNSTLDPVELERERNVVLEEIAMTQDSPEDLVFDKASEAYFAGTALEREILGVEETVSRMESKDLAAYMRSHYTAENMVIAAAGRFDEAALLAELEAKFSGAARGTRRVVPTHTVRDGLSFSFAEKDVEQIHTVLMFPGAPLRSKESYALSVLSNILGGSMSSRLFQHIREERGLCYSVYSYPMSYRGVGALCLYVGSTEKQTPQAVRLMLDEIVELRKNGVNEREFLRCKQQLKGSYLLGMESASAHMNAIGKSALLMQEAYDLEATLGRIEGVSIEDVNRMIPAVFSTGRMTASAVGRSAKLFDSLRGEIGEWFEKGR